MNYVKSYTSRPKNGGFNLWILVLAFAMMTPFSAHADSVESGGRPIPKEKVTNLTKCPDCLGAVSQRAVMCPHCGCPGEVIVAAVEMEKLAAEPKSIVKVVADKVNGSGVAVKDGDLTYVVFDAFLLADSTKLELHDVRNDAMLPYSQVALAEQNGLMRLAVKSDQVVFSELVDSSFEGVASQYLDIKGFPSNKKKAVVFLNNSGQISSIMLDGAKLNIHSSMKWKSVQPKQLRKQLNLLARMKRDKAKGKTPTLSAEEAATSWLTPYFSRLAKQLTQ